MAIDKINLNGTEYSVGGSGGSDLNTTFKIAYIGDSITDERVGYQMSGNFTYPRQLNRLMGATSYASTAVAGNTIENHLATQVSTVAANHKDSDLVIVMLGINDAYQGYSNNSYTTLGDGSAIAAATQAQCAPGGTYGSTVLGIFKYQLMSLREALDTNTNALGHICVVSPIGSSLDYTDTTLTAYLTNMREGMRKIIDALGVYPNSESVYNGWYYIDGKEIFPYKTSYDSTTVTHTELIRQGVHPNLQGEGMIAKGIFDRLPDLKLYKSLGLNE